MQVRWKNEVLWLGQLLPELLCLMLFRTLRGIWGDTRRACSSWTVLRRECRFPRLSPAACPQGSPSQTRSACPAEFGRWSVSLSISLNCFIITGAARSVQSRML